MIRATSQPARQWLLLALAISAMSMAGCQSSRSAHWADAPGRYGIADRSLATDSLTLQSASARRPMDRQTAAWLESRNDARKATIYGHEQPQWQQTVTYRYDRQITANGRTYDYGHTTTYQVTVSQP